MCAARSWSLRVATPDDADAVSALLERSYPVLWRGHYAPALIEAVRPLVTRANPRLLASGTFFVVTRDGGQAVACGGWSHEAPGTGERTPGVGHIRHFATDADWLRRGMAGAVLRRCIEEAGAAGLAALMADSALGAERFYAAFGFEPLGPSAPLIGGHVLPGTVMRLDLGR